MFVATKIHQNIKVPAVTKDEYTVMDVDASSGIVSVLTASGDVKDDLNLPKSAENPNVLDEIGELLAKKFEAGEEVKVAVLGILGQEKIIEVVG